MRLVLTLSIASLVAAADPPKTLLDDILTEVRDGKIRTVESLISSLPPSMRADYVLMTETGSQHQAKNETPRVILFDRRKEDQPLLIAFSGKADDPRYLVVEAMQFRPETKRWDLREITFPAADAKGNATISDANPKQCLKCHEGGGRPIWEPYNHWPGAVGSESRLSAKKDELKYLDDFRAKGKKHPRYQLLDREKNYQQQVFGTGKSDEDSPFSFALVGVIDRANHGRIADLMTKTKDFAAYKYAILAALYRCPAMESFVPASHGGEKGLQEFQKSTKAAMKGRHGELAERVALPVEMAASLRFIFEPRGIDVDWNTSRTLPYVLDTTNVGFAEFTPKFQKADPDLAKLDTKYLPLLEAGTFSRENDKDTQAQLKTFCDDLKNKSLTALATLARAPKAHGAIPEPIPGKPQHRGPK